MAAYGQNLMALGAGAYAVSAPPIALPVIPLRVVARWLTFAAFLLLAIYFAAAADQGATALVPGKTLHELVHDARHLFGFPSH